MKVINNFVQGKMDKDLDIRLLPQGVYRDAVNVRIGGSEDGNVGVVEKLRGTLELSVVPDLPAGMEPIGMKAEGDYVYYIATDNTNTWIGRYNKKLNTHQYITKSTLFDLNKDVQIVQMEIFEGLLIFMDKNNAPPYKINIDKAIGDPSYYANGDDVTLVKAPPKTEPTVVFDTNDDVDFNLLKEESYQFAYQYVYEDGEISAISFYSKTDVDLVEAIPDAGNAVVSVFGTGTTEEYEFVLSRDRFGTETEITKRVTGSTNDVRDIVISFEDVENQATSPIDIFYVTSKDFIHIVSDAVPLFTGARKTIGDASIAPSPGTYPRGVAMSDNANVVIAGSVNGSNYEIYRYVSEDGDQLNAVLAATLSGTFKGRKNLAVNGDGSKAFCCYGNSIYRSVNAASTGSFKKVLDIDDLDGLNSSFWGQSIACSYDGLVIYATVAYNTSATAGQSAIIKSSDGGDTWEVSYYDNNLTSLWMCDIVCSFDGKVAYATANSIGITSLLRPELYFSYDEGNSWTGKQIGSSVSSADGYDINDITISSSGKFVYLSYVNETGGNWDGEIQLSLDYGGIFIRKYNRPIGTSLAQISTISNEELSRGINNIDTRYNEATITYNTGNKHVEKIRLMMIAPNTGTAYLIKEIDKRAASPTIPDNTDKVFVFYNDGTYPVVSLIEKNKLYDNVPQKARAFTLTQNSLIFGGYSDGYSLTYLGDPIKEDAGLQIVEKVIPEDTTQRKSLKSGSINTYGIIYYDAFNRSSSVLEIGDLRVSEARNLFIGDTFTGYMYATVTIRHRPPEWATKYKICKKDVQYDYAIIDGFDNAYAVGGEIYLEVTSYTDYSFKEGDFLKLFSVIDTSDNETAYVPARKTLNVRISRYVDNAEAISSVQAELSDGTTTARSTTETRTAEPVPPGRYIVIAAPDVEGYLTSDILRSRDAYDSSVFYIEKPKDLEQVFIYREIPGTYDIINGFHQGNQQNQTTLQPAEISLENLDYDIVWGLYPVREMYLYTPTRRFINLGRPNAVSENFRQIDRFAGLISTEAYVEDTNFNGLSSVNLGLIPYKDLLKKDDEIEFLDSEDTNVEVYQKNRLSRVLYKKNIVTSPDGSGALAQTDAIWGNQIRSTQIYGMTHSESFAEWNFQKYFVDTRRGVVLRKSQDGCTEISGYGMIDFFHDLLDGEETARIIGYYEPKFKNYVLIVYTDSVSEGVMFSEKVNGWESRLDIRPDKTTNDGTNVYSFKNGKLWRHDYTDDYNTLFDELFPASIDYVLNQGEEAVKVYAAIRIDGDKPDRVLFQANQAAELDSTYFETREGYHYAYIPPAKNLNDHLTKIAGLVNGTVTAATVIPMKNYDKTTLRVGNPLYKSGVLTELGLITDFDDTSITIDTPVSLSDSDLLYSIEDSVVDGDLIRGDIMEVKVIYDDADFKQLNSVMIELDESKQ